MARNFVSASNEYVKTAQTFSAGSAYPFTIACWAKTTDLTTEQHLIQLGEGGVARRHRLIVGGDVAGDPIRMNTNASSSNVYANSAAGISSGVWFHAAGIIRADKTRSSYLNGGNRGNSTSTLTWETGVGEVVIGGVGAASISGDFDGDIAEAAVWNAELTDSEIAILGSVGASPLLVRPQSLSYYLPMVREITAFKGSPPSTINGTTVANHPRIYMPRGGIVWPKLVGGAASGSITTTLDAALQKAFSAVTTLNASLQKTFSQGSTLDAALLVEFSESADLDAALYKAFIVSANLEAALQVAFIEETTLDAALRKSMLLQASVDTAIQQTKTLATTLSAYLFDGGSSVVAEVDAVLRKTIYKTTTLNAALLKQNSQSTTIAAALNLTRALSSQINAVLVYRRSLSAVLNVVITKTLIRSASVDAVIGEVALEYARLLVPKRTEQQFSPESHQIFKART